MSDKWKRILASVAPGLATALGGPLAGTAVAAIGKAILGKDNATEAEVAEAVETASPETLVALRQADKQFEVRMAELDLDLERLAVEDRISARTTMVATRIWPQVVLSGVFDGGYIALVIYLFAGEWAFTPEQMALVTAVVGVLTAGVIQTLNFWFGSSLGSKVKTDALVNTRNGN